MASKLYLKNVTDYNFTKMGADNNLSDAYSPCHVFQYMKYKAEEKATVFTRALDAIGFLGETSACQKEDNTMTAPKYYNQHIVIW